MPNWTGKWEGGRSYATGDGRTVYVIQRDVHGQTRSISLDARNVAEARAELALFNRDRAAYLTKTQAAARDQEEDAKAQADAVLVDPRTVADFLAYVAAPDDDKAPRSPLYITNTRNYLGGWADLLAGKDLRFLKLTDLQKALLRNVKVAERKGRAPAPPRPMPRKKAIIAVKSLASWLESRGRLEPGQNPTRGLKVPPARRVPTPKGYDLATIEGVYAKLSSPTSKTRKFLPATAQAVRDVYQLAARHGLHYSEIERIASGETVRTLDAEAPIAGVVEFRHKNGDRHVLSLTPESLAAAVRLQAAGGAPAESVVRKYLAHAAKALSKRTRLRMGQLRHSYITLAQTHGEAIYPITKGVPLAIISQTVGHKSTLTGSRFYSNVAVPVLIRLPLRLVHPDDPPASAPVGV